MSGGKFEFFEFYPASLAPGRDPYLRLRYDEGTIGIKGGGAGWEAVPRPLKRPLTVWRGAKEPYTLAISALFDGWDGPHAGKSVEREVRMLEEMAGINVDGDPPPPLLILDGYGALPHDYTTNPKNRWVISEPPEYAEVIRRLSDGERTRQAVKITFMLHTEENRLDRAKRQSPGRTTIARQGDTFTRIAARVLRHAKWGTRLAVFNGERDAAFKLHPGQVVRLPSAQQEREWKRQPRR